MKKAFSIAVLAGLLATFASHSAMAEENEKGERKHHPMAERMRHVDKDGDGYVSKEEAMDAAEKRFEKRDMNGDGKISRDEAKKVRENRRERHKDRREHRKERREEHRSGE